MRSRPFFLNNFMPGKMISYFKPDRFFFVILEVSILITLINSAVFSDGIVLRNGMQMVVTIRDTTGDSISVQEGMWEAGISKSIIASFWYKGNQYSYVRNNTVNRYSSSTVPNSNKEFNTGIVTRTISNDSSINNQKTETNIDHVPQEDDILPLPYTKPGQGELQLSDTMHLNVAKLQSEQIQEINDTVMLADLDLGDYDTTPEKSDELEPLLLFDPEYTNEELVKKKRVFRTLLIAGCAMGATSTPIFIANDNWDIKMMAVPFMIASIPLTTIGTVKSIEYSKRFKAAEYKKHRAQMSLSLHIQRADLLIAF